MSAASDLIAQKKSLEALEARTVSGAPTLTPKQQMLDARDVEAKHPDEKLRWVNIRDRQKAESRKIEGYTRLSAAEGGKAIGDETALFSIPRPLWEARRDQVDKLTDERLNAHRHEMEAAAESVARQLKDRHGIDISAERILVTE